MRSMNLLLLAASAVLTACAGAARPAAPVQAASAADPAHPQAEQWYFWTDDGVRHFAYDLGTAGSPGDTVVVLHGGWGAEHSSLIRPLLPLADRYRFVFYDQRGSLRSPAPDSMIRLPRLVADLEHLRRSLGLEEMTLAAHSMGAALAYAYISKHPDHVRGLVLLGPVLPASSTPAGKMAFIRQVWPDADSAALAGARERFFEELGPRTLRILEQEGLIPDSLRGVPWDSLDLQSALSDDRSRTRAWRISFASVSSCSGDNWREMQGGMAFYSGRASREILRDPGYEEQVARFWEALQRFERPVRVIIGTCDYIDPGPILWPRIVQALPDGDVTVVQGAGHSIWLDRPGALRDALGRALAEATRE